MIFFSLSLYHSPKFKAQPCEVLGVSECMWGMKGSAGSCRIRPLLWSRSCALCDLLFLN